MRMLSLLSVLLCGCSSDLLGPEDPRCTITISKDDVAYMTRWQYEHCKHVRVVVL